MTHRRIVAIAAGVLLIAAALGLGGCSTARTFEYEEVPLRRAEGEVPAARRLDVGIVIFDPGLPEDGLTDDEQLVFREIRGAEARYMPFQLKQTLEASGEWGPVWVVPERSDAVELTVWGRIEHSDGLEPRLRIGAWDATGKEWLNKTYQTLVPEKAYSKVREAGQDPYQNLYNEIANDLLAARNKLSDKEAGTIREIAGLRYGQELVPTAFDGLIAQDGKGIWELQRLPAESDPMVGRMQSVREREYALLDTLNEYYAGLYYELSQPYEDWRRMSREEMIRYQDLRRSALVRTTAGALAIAAAILYGSQGGSNDAITMIGVIGGIEGIKSGLGKAAEAGIHKESLKELGGSFDAEAEPLVVEIEGQTKRLQGTAEERYQEWRRLLHEIYAAETGVPIAPPPAAAAE